MLPRFSLKLKTLVWLGFVFNLGLLLVAGLSTMYSMDKIHSLSRETVYKVFETTQQSRMLIEHLTDMERSVNQYLVLDDDVFLDNYINNHKKFSENLQELSDLNNDGQIRELKLQLEGRQDELYRKVVASDLTKEEKQKALEGFRKLNSLAYALLHASSQFVGADADRLDKESEWIITRLLTLTGILLITSILLIFVFANLIIRPIRQLDWAIRSLGSGDFDRSVHVDGPRDLEYLGKRLDLTRKRLKDLEESKQRFFRDVSHELKTPLAKIHQGSELLADEVAGKLNDEQKNIIDILIKSSKQLETLITDILKFNKVQTSGKKSKREKVNLTELILVITEDHQINLTAHELILDLHLDQVEIYGSAEGLKTVLNNLLSNALKFSPPKSKVRISLHKVRAFVQLDVEDEGPGVPKEERKKIFERFYQVEETSSPDIKGSGLGLSIVSEIITAHKGHVEVVEKKPEIPGALFRVLLPLDFRR